VPRKPRTTKQIVAFKVEPELAAVLDAMPNKSEFIRAAVQNRLEQACPLCRGTGIAPSGGASGELAKLVSQHPLVVCAGCGAKEPRPCHSPGHCHDEPRLESFERWGVFVCDACGPQFAFCKRCHKVMAKTEGRTDRVGLCAACKSAHDPAQG
jgi:hypothetical protein